MLRIKVVATNDTDVLCSVFRYQFYALYIPGFMYQSVTVRRAHLVRK